MIRPVLVLCSAVVASTLSCVPYTRDTAHNRVWNVAPRDLHKAYVAGDDSRWDGQVVRVAIGAHNYTCGPGTVNWIGGRATDAPDVVFVCDAPPPNPTKPVTVTGTVKGRVADTERRSSRLTYHVRVEGCVVTVR